MVALFVWTLGVWHREGTCLGMAFLCKHTRNTETRVFKYRYADVQNVLRWDIYVNVHLLSKKCFLIIDCQNRYIHSCVKSFNKDLVENKARWMFFYNRCLTWWLQSIFVEMMTVTKIPLYGVFNTRLQLIKINKDLTARINGQTLAISSLKLGEEKLCTNVSFSLGWLKVALEGNFWVFSLVLGQLTVHHTPPSPPPSPQFVFSLSWQMPCKKKWSPQLCNAFYVFFESKTCGCMNYTRITILKQEVASEVHEL